MTFPVGDVVEFFSGGPRVDRGSGETMFDDWDHPVSEGRYEHVGVEDAQTNEIDSAGRVQVVHTRNLYFWGEIVAVSREWRCLVRGDLMRVHGRPAQWSNPFVAWDAGTVVELRWADG